MRMSDHRKAEKFCAEPYCWESLGEATKRVLQRATTRQNLDRAKECDAFHPRVYS
jgi:hypothetical protein